ncbi:MAG: hypothetical protein WCU88_06570 [Elusimicrobiota bacterium]|jgi:hypothetical protein
MKKHFAAVLAALQILLVPGSHAYAAAFTQSAAAAPASLVPASAVVIPFSQLPSLPLELQKTLTGPSVNTPALPAPSQALQNQDAQFRRENSVQDAVVPVAQDEVHPSGQVREFKDTAAASSAVNAVAAAAALQKDGSSDQSARESDVHGAAVMFDNAKASDSGLERAPVDIRMTPEQEAALSPSQRTLAAKLMEALGPNIFYWKNFPVRLPSTVFSEDAGRIIDVKDLFKAPTSDEVYRLGTSEDGKGPRLSAEQLAQIKKNGTFDVPSVDYPGQPHIWKLGGLLQKGQEAIRETLLRHQAAALEQVIVGIPDRVWKADRLFSVRGGLQNLREGFTDALSLFIGFPETHPREDVEEAIEKARRQYVLEMAERGSDTRLYDAKLMAEASSVVYDIARSSSEEWEKRSADVQAAIEKELKDKGVAAEQVPQLLADRMVEAQNQAFFDAILASPTLGKLSPGLGGLLVEHARAELLVRRAAQDLQRETAAFAAKTLVELEARFPVRSRIRAWLTEQARAASEKQFMDRARNLQADLPAMLRKAGLAREAYFLELDISFYNYEEGALRARLEGERETNAAFEHHRIIWRPSKWKVEKWTSPDGDVHLYTLNTLQTIRVESKDWGWRLRNMFVRMWTWTNNAAHLLIFENLVNGPLGWRSLLGDEPFLYRWTAQTGIVELEGPARGTLRSRVKGFYTQRRAILDDFGQRKNYGLLGKGVKRFFLGFYTDLGLAALIPAATIAGQITLTLLNTAASSALAITAWIWGPAAAVIAWLCQAAVFDFEGTHYGRSRWLKGLGQAGGWGVGLAGLFAASFFISIPAWALWLAPVPMLAALNPRLFPLLGAAKKAAILGVGNILAGAAGTVLHGGASIAAIASGAARTGLRTPWDAAMRVVLSRRGRIPSGDERFVVYRIAGPGLSSEYFFQVSPDLVLVALQAGLESSALGLYDADASELIRLPRRTFEEALAALDAVTGRRGGYEEKSPAFSQLSEHEKAQLSDLKRAVAERAQLYDRLLGMPKGQRVKLAAREYEPTLQKAVVLTKNFHEKLFKDSGWDADKVRAFWKQSGLAQNDWEGLARTRLEGIFGESVLLPLEETDKDLKIEVQAPGLGDFAAAIAKGILPEDAAAVRLTGRGRANVLPEPRVARIDPGMVTRLLQPIE